MAFKVNYGLERAERNRAKQAKKEAKAKAKKSGLDTEAVKQQDPLDSSAARTPTEPQAD